MIIEIGSDGKVVVRSDKPLSKVEKEIVDNVKGE